MIIPCLLVNHASELRIPNLADGVSVESYNGVRPYPSAGKLNFTYTGHCYNVALSNGSFYPLQERQGPMIYDVSPNRRHGTFHEAIRTQVESNRDADLWELQKGFNSYFVGEGTGFRVSNYPLTVAFTASLLVHSKGGQLVLEFKGTTNTATATIDIASQAKWITLRKNNDVWVIFLDGREIATVNQAVGGAIAGDIDALIGSNDLPIATREFLLWNRALTNAEIASGVKTIANPDIRFHASSSSKNPVKNLATDEQDYAGQGQPVIANVPAEQGADALGQTAESMNITYRPRIRSVASYNDYRKPILTAGVVPKGDAKKFLYINHVFTNTKRSLELVRVLEVAR